MKKTKKGINRIGKIGRANIEANKRLRDIFLQMGIEHCELRLPGCTGGLFLTPAHRHKRLWYRGDVEKLSDYRQVICACVNCHNQIEVDPVLTETMFLRIRGYESDTTNT